MKATVVEHTVWVIDTLCWRCTSSVRVALAFSSLKCYVTYGTQGRTCDLPVGLDIWDKVVSSPFSSSMVQWDWPNYSFHQCFQVECIEFVDRRIDQSVTNDSVGWFIDPSQDPNPSHLPHYPFTEGASHAKRRTSLFISRISWTQRTYSRHENE